MDIGEYQERIRQDFKTLVEMFKKNFGHLDTEKLRQIKIKISDLTDLLKYKEKPKY